MPRHASITWPGVGTGGCTQTDTTVRFLRARVSVHLSCLADCGYVAARRGERKPRYSVAEPRVADLVVLARSLAADNATALDRCTRTPPTEKAATR